MGVQLPPPTGTRTLGWHYRSRDERLIAFSNAQPNLYNWALTTFPGVAGPECLSHVAIPFRPGRIGQEDSVTDEVARVAGLVAEHARSRPEVSLGVIAMGIKHANRIQEALRQARAADEQLDAFLSGAASARAGKEPFFVKNLERVQGDERDAIILTIGYGKNADGRMLYRFGPINNQGGERRLNVAITRARISMMVVSSFSILPPRPGTVIVCARSTLSGLAGPSTGFGARTGSSTARKRPFAPLPLIRRQLPPAIAGMRLESRKRKGDRSRAPATMRPPLGCQAAPGCARSGHTAAASTNTAPGNW